MLPAIFREGGEHVSFMTGTPCQSCGRRPHEYKITFKEGKKATRQEERCAECCVGDRERLMAEYEKGGVMNVLQHVNKCVKRGVNEEISVKRVKVNGHHIFHGFANLPHDMKVVEVQKCELIIMRENHNTELSFEDRVPIKHVEILPLKDGKIQISMLYRFEEGGENISLTAEQEETLKSNIETAEWKEGLSLSKARQNYAYIFASKALVGQELMVDKSGKKKFLKQCEHKKVFKTHVITPSKESKFFITAALTLTVGDDSGKLSHVDVECRTDTATNVIVRGNRNPNKTSFCRSGFSKTSILGTRKRTVGDQTPAKKRAKVASQITPPTSNIVNTDIAKCLRDTREAHQKLRAEYTSLSKTQTRIQQLMTEFKSAKFDNDMEKDMQAQLTLNKISELLK